MPPSLNSTPQVRALVQTLITAEVGYFFAAAPDPRSRIAPNRLLCLDQHPGDGKPGTLSPPPAAAGWAAVRRVLGWEHGLRSEAGRVRFVEQIVTLHSPYEDLNTVQAMVSHAVQRGWRSVCLMGSEEFLQRARLAALALGLRVEQALVPA